MIGITSDKVCAEINAICALTRFNEHMRAHVIEERDLSDVAVERSAANYVEGRRHVPEAIQWKVFSHCAAVTRLYALYEGFVYDLVAAWLNVLPSIYGSYALVPSAVLNQHRTGIGTLLQKFGGGARTEGLTELGILEPLYLGLSGKPTFTLVPDAFFIDLRNLRQSELATLFSKVSLANLGNWLRSHEGLRSLCDPDGTTPEARLNELVDYRNDASHAHRDIDDTLGTSAFEGLATFIREVCVALHQFVQFKYIDALQDAGKLDRLGKIHEFFDRPKAAILTIESRCRIKLGDELIVRVPRAVYSAKVTSIQDHGNEVNELEPNAGHEVGLKLDPPAPKNALLFRLRVEP